MTVIGAFQIYESVVVLTDGGPGDSSRSVVMYLAEIGFQQFELGYASAIAVSLFAIVATLTAIQFGLPGPVGGRPGALLQARRDLRNHAGRFGHGGRRRQRDAGESGRPA